MDLGQIMALLILGISAMLLVAPPFGVWRSLSRPAAASPTWLRVTFALIGPFLVTFVVVVLMWLPGYTGQCGGWLGETSPCSGFGQYASETMYWAGISMAMPGLLGMLLGLVVLVFGLIRRGMARSVA
jgi:hypothetical protein